MEKALEQGELGSALENQRAGAERCWPGVPSPHAANLRGCLSLPPAPAPLGHDANSSQRDNKEECPRGWEPALSSQLCGYVKMPPFRRALGQANCRPQNDRQIEKHRNDPSSLRNQIIRDLHQMAASF